MTKNNFSNDIGENLRNMMNKRGITQTGLTNQTNIDKSLLSHYVNGDRIPSLTHLISICYVLKCRLNEIIILSDFVE